MPRTFFPPSPNASRNLNLKQVNFMAWFAATNCRKVKRIYWHT